MEVEGLEPCLKSQAAERSGYFLASGGWEASFPAEKTSPPSARSSGVAGAQGPRLRTSKPAGSGHGRSAGLRREQLCRVQTLRAPASKGGGAPLRKETPRPKKDLGRANAHPVIVLRKPQKQVKFDKEVQALEKNTPTPISPYLPSYTAHLRNAD